MSGEKGICLLSPKRIKILAEACQVVRPVCLSVLAIAIVAAAMAFKGRHIMTAALGGVIVVIAGLMVFQVHRAVSHLNQKSEMLREASDAAEEHYVRVLWQIVRFVEAREKHRRGHSERVAALAGQIAHQMGLSSPRCQQLELASRLHDLGMLVVPEKILHYPGKIGVHEFRTIQKHPKIAHEILKPLKSLAAALPAILHHHERMNGTGYPVGLRGQEIPVEARILAVADAYDAMTHDWPYHSAMSDITAMTELRRCCPAGYDPAVVDTLAEVKHLPQLEEAMACVE